MTTARARLGYGRAGRDLAYGRLTAAWGTAARGAAWRDDGAAGKK